MSEEALPGEWRQVRHVPGSGTTCTCPGVTEGMCLQALDQLDHQAASNQQSRLVVCGCKGAGKSTFARLLTNQLLSRAGASLAYLDTDCGQAEFTPAGLSVAGLLSSCMPAPCFCEQHVLCCACRPDVAPPSVNSSCRPAPSASTASR